MTNELNYDDSEWLNYNDAEWLNHNDKEAKQPGALLTRVLNNGLKE
ncbi:MAG: hypothetical protein V4594_04965 [Bacteroidota bacterium]